MPNKLKTLRESRGISLQELADEVAASPLEIHRIEVNKYPAPIKLAKAICEVIGYSVEAVFPGAERVFAALTRVGAHREKTLDEMYDTLRRIGIEYDDRQHMLEVRMRGHDDANFFAVQARDVSRLLSALRGDRENGSELQFIVFDTYTCRVAINLRMAVLCHFSSDNNFALPRAAVAAAIASHARLKSVQVFFGDNPSPSSIDVIEEDCEAMDSQRNFVNDVFWRLEQPELMNFHRLYIVDQGGESVFLRAGDISLICAPLRVFDKDEHLGDDSDVEEDIHPD